MKSLQAWLLEANLISQQDLEPLQRNETLEGYALASALLEHRIVDEQALVTLASQKLGVPVAPPRLHRVSIVGSILSQIPEDLCWQHHFFPFGIEREGGRLKVAMADPTDPEALAALRSTLGHQPRIHIIGPHQLEKAIRKHYLDSWVEETKGGPLRFFGYDRITNPGHNPKRAPSDEPASERAAPAEAAAGVAPLEPLPPEPSFEEPGLTAQPDEDEPTRKFEGTEDLAQAAAGKQPPKAALGRIALLDERAVMRRRLDALERALGELLGVLGGLPDERVSAEVAEIKRRLDAGDPT